MSGGPNLSFHTWWTGGIGLLYSQLHGRVGERSVMFTDLQSVFIPSLVSILLLDEDDSVIG